MKARYHRRDRVALSEIMGALLTIAITLIAGAAVFSYVNNEAGVSENRLGVAVAGTANFLSERFVVVDMAFNTNTNTAVIWIYNNGNITLQLSRIALYDSTKNQMYVTYTGGPPTSGCGSSTTPSVGVSGPSIGAINIAPRSQPAQITMTLPPGCSFSSGSTYYVNLLGLNGNDVLYYSVL